MYGIAADSTSHRAIAHGAKTSAATQKAIAGAAGTSRRPAGWPFHSAAPQRRARGAARQSAPRTRS